MKALLLIIFLLSVQQASAQRCNMLFSYHPVPRVTVLDGIPEVNNIYHSTIIEFIKTYNNFFNSRPTTELFNPLNAELFNQKDLKRQLIYILKNWRVEANTPDVLIKMELIASIEAIKTDYKLLYLKRLTNELYSILLNLSVQRKADIGSSFEDIVYKINEAYNKSLH